MSIRMRSSKLVSVALIATGCLLTVTGGTLTAARAVAEFQYIAETGKPGLLRLAVQSDTPLWGTIRPGGSAEWLVRASLDGQRQGPLEIEVAGHGGLLDVASLIVQVDVCSGQFDTTGIGLPNGGVVCGGTRSTVLAPIEFSQLVHASDRYQLPPLSQDDPREFLVVLSMPSAAGAGAISGQSASIGLGVHTSGQDAEVQAPTPEQASLAMSGSDLLALGVLAVGMIVVGGGVRVLRRSRLDELR